MELYFALKLRRKRYFIIIGICLIIIRLTTSLHSKRILDNIVKNWKIFSRADLLLKIKRREKLLAEISDYRKQNAEQYRKRLPKVIGIGVKKCGTDALIKFLDYHPLVNAFKENNGETFYFTNYPQEYFEDEFGIDFYRHMFPPTNDREITMEKTPIYFDHPPHDLPKRIKFVVPGVKLLLIVCDPTPRAFSDYVHERTRHELFHDRMMADYPNFTNFLDVHLTKLKKYLKYYSISKLNPFIQKLLTNLFKTDPATSLLSSGLYFYHIQRWRRVFNDSSLMIIDGDKFLNNPGPIIEDIQDFIGIPKLLWKEDFVKHPKSGFYCYRHFDERYFNISSMMSVEDILHSIKCLGSLKGRTRNGAKRAKAADFRRLKKFYSKYNQAFFHEIKRKFKWS